MLDGFEDVFPAEALLVHISRLKGLLEWNDGFAVSAAYSSEDLHAYKLANKWFSMSSYLGHNNNLVSRKVELFDCLSQNNLRKAIGVDLEEQVNKWFCQNRRSNIHVSSIESLNPRFISK